MDTPTRRGARSNLPAVLKATAAVLTATGGLLVTLNQLGLLSHKPDPAPTPPHAETSAPQPRPTTLSDPAPSPAAPVDISGLWHDATGTVYQVQQSGESFEFVAANPSTGVQSRGSGTVRGHHMENAFQTSVGSTGRGSGEISADGRQITGNFQDTYYGVYALTLYR